MKASPAILAAVTAENRPRLMLIIEAIQLALAATEKDAKK